MDHTLVVASQNQSILIIILSMIKTNNTRYILSVKNQYNFFSILLIFKAQILTLPNTKSQIKLSKNFKFSY